jgi:hypothetical protein
MERKMPQDTTATLPPLGVGELIAQSFRLLLAHFGTLFPLAFVPALVISLLGWMVTPVPPPDVDPAASPVAAIGLVPALVGLLLLVGGYFVMGFMSLAALDAVLGKRHTVGEYSAQTLRHLAPIVVLGVLLSIAMTIGAILLIVPGLYIAARYFPWVPAIVFENAGWSGLARARDLTGGYRWPLVGAVLVVVLVIIAAILVLVPLSLALGGGVLSVLLEAVVTGIYYAFASVLTALVYARLREIKEGLTIPQIAALID